MYIESFVNITSRAWALPILSNLHAGIAGRQAPLLTATGASRTAFDQSIEHLINLGLLERNPGYGHPLRPEFRMTENGKQAAAIANRIQRATTDADRSLLRRSWTLPVLRAVHTPCRFIDMKRTLETISDRALSQSLKTMEAKNWVRRSIDDKSRPPRPIYCAINTGKILSTVTATEILLASPT